MLISIFLRVFYILEIITSFFLFLISFFSKKLKERLKFELMNRAESAWGDQSVAFEFSSEGEFEYLRPLIDRKLKQNRQVVLIYSSPSVEERAKAYRDKKPELIQLFRLDLLGRWKLFSKYRFENRVMSLEFIQGRYDFFAFLLLWGHQRKRRSTLVGLSLVKNYHERSRLLRFKIQVLQTVYSKIYLLGKRDLDLLREMNIHGVNEEQIFNPRFNQIYDRALASKIVLKKHIPGWEYLSKLMDSHRLNQRLIFGSMWDSEVDLINDKIIEENGHSRLFISIVPHHIDAYSIELFKQKLAHKTELYIIFESTSKTEMDNFVRQYLERGGVFIFAIKGVLCELYSYHGLSYVGGGFGKGIHSVLEPIVSGCLCLCGPKVRKSPEFYFVQSHFPDKIVKLDTQNRFYDYFCKLASSVTSPGNLNNDLDSEYAKNNRIIELI
jgi:3-deoxy-D-manno-octulosonic-acid transferase